MPISAKKNQQKNKSFTPFLLENDFSMSNSFETYGSDVARAKALLYLAFKKKSKMFHFFILACIT